MNLLRLKIKDATKILLMAISLQGVIVLDAGFLSAQTLEEATDCTTRGKNVFEKCATCHDTDPEEGHRVAPNLFGILGMPVGKQEGFKYSKTMRNSNDTWTQERLKAFLEYPRYVYPRTSMGFAGLKKHDDLEDVVCFLETLQ